MAGERESWHPGMRAPRSGIYECDGRCGHLWSTEAAGHRFPTLPPECDGLGWRLATAKPHA
ncbi:hypothetical protein DQ384_31625 [Sphaerisporangium album]|uniref:Uncharacterized protein n=1 Tax=Sphaerisporangium album TaxID=509200 RepID=A0A367F4Y7_9ACTN|nr:hypothetical protein DQ384_31625 [Sphaerisporangium album]